MLGEGAEEGGRRLVSLQSTMNRGAKCIAQHGQTARLGDGQTQFLKMRGPTCFEGAGAARTRKNS